MSTALELSGILRDGREHAERIAVRAETLVAAFQALSGDPSLAEVNNALNDLYFGLLDIAFAQHKVGIIWKTLQDQIVPTSGS